MFRPRVSAYSDSASLSFSSSLTESLNELSDVSRLARAKEEVKRIIESERPEETRSTREANE